MKTILVVVALCFVGALAVKDKQKAKLVEFKNSCITKTGVDAQVVEDAKNGKIKEGDEKLSCFLACMMKKIGVMNPDGTVNEELFKKKAPPTATKEQVQELLTKCKGTTGTNDCDKAAKLVKCYKENKSFDVLS